MNKSFFILLGICFIFLMPSTSNAQIYYGFGIGPSQSKYHHSLGFQNGELNPMSTGGLTTSVGVGMLLFNRRASVSIMPSFTKGGNISESIDNYTYTDRNGNPTLGFFTITEKFNTITIPLQLRTQFGGRFGVTAAIALGAQIRLNKGKGEVVVTDLIANTSSLLEEYEIEFGSRISPYKTTDVFFTFSPGLYYDLDIDGVWRLTLSTGFQWGLKDMITDGYRNLTDILGEQRQKTTSFKLGIEFCPWCYN